MKNIAREKTKHRNVSEKIIRHFGPRILLSNLEVGMLISRVKDIVMRLPDRTHAASTNRANLLPLRIVESVAGGLIQHLISTNGREESCSLGVGEDLDLFLQAKHLLLEITNRLTGRISDGRLRR